MNLISIIFSLSFCVFRRSKLYLLKYKMAEGNQPRINLEDLPHVILWEILDYLDHDDLKKLALVSKKFYYLCRNKKFISQTEINLDRMDNIDEFNTEIWRYPGINIFGDDNLKILQFTTEHGHLVKSLRMGFLSELLLDILKRTPNLYKFTYFGTSDDEDMVVPVVNQNSSNLPMVREFKFVNVGHDDYYLTQMLPMLRNADIKVGTMFRDSSSNAYEILDSLNTNLKELHMIVVFNDGNESLNINLIVQKFQDLESLAIKSVGSRFHVLVSPGSLFGLKYLILNCIKIERNITLQLFETFKNLKSLVMVGCEGFGNEDIILTLKELKDLKEFECRNYFESNEVYNGEINFPKNENMFRLSLDVNSKFPEKFMTHIADNLPNLKILILKRCIKLESINSVKCILKKCQYLNTLAFYVNNDYDANYEEEQSPIILDDLKYLSLGGIMIGKDFLYPKLNEFKIERCAMFTRVELERIAINCPMLQKLHVYSCGINKTFIPDFIRSGGFQMIKRVTLCNCHLPEEAIDNDDYFGGVPQLDGVRCFQAH